MFFKDLSGAIHFLDDISKLNLLPAGSVSITKQDAENMLKPTVEELAMQEKEKIKSELLLLDAATIRAMREYIASKADAPQILKDRETLAAELRAKLK